MDVDALARICHSPVLSVRTEGAAVIFKTTWGEHVLSGEIGKNLKVGDLIEFKFAHPVGEHPVVVVEVKPVVVKPTPIANTTEGRKGQKSPKAKRESEPTTDQASPPETAPVATEGQSADEDLPPKVPLTRRRKKKGATDDAPVDAPVDAPESKS